jgi:hypothetical protein
MPPLTVEFSEDQLVPLLEEGSKHDRSAVEQVQALVERDAAAALAAARDAFRPERLALIGRWRRRARVRLRRGGGVAGGGRGLRAASP